MTSAALPAILAWIPFVNPIDLPEKSRLLMFLPLAFCVAAVYRATRARETRGLAWPIFITFGQIVVGMVLIAVGFYLAHQLVIRFA